MDSMRSLDSSLPAATKRNDAPEQLLDAFKAAALSVTRLYKAADQGKAAARAEGYQDALDELLSFLDKENMGLTDGEGWRIRRWATERLDGRAVSPNGGMETDDDAEDIQDRGSSPEISRSQSATRRPSLHTSQTPRAASPLRAASQPPLMHAPIPSEQVNTVPPQGAFNFRSSIGYPSTRDLTPTELDLSSVSQHSNDTTIMSYTSSPVSRSIRTSSRHTNHPARPGGRGGSTIARPGQKRKATPSEMDLFNGFFPTSRDYRDGNDGFGGGGKRSKYA